MPKINSLEEFRVKLMRSRIAFATELTAALKIAVVKVQSDAKKKFGTYQPAVGPFNEWAKLSDAYLKEKLKAGGGEDPLIGHYSGKRKNSVYPTPLRNSILTEVRDFRGYVGTNDPLGEWHEFGTSRGIPPRPFLRPALYENRDFIKKLFEAAIVKTLTK